MAAAGDFNPSNDADFIDEPINPVVFGIELSPQIIGAVIAILGLAGVGYLFVKLVQRWRQPMPHCAQILRPKRVSSFLRLRSYRISPNWRLS